MPADGSGRQPATSFDRPIPFPSINPLHASPSVVPADSRCSRRPSMHSVRPAPLRETRGGRSQPQPQALEIERASEAPAGSRRLKPDGRGRARSSRRRRRGRKGCALFYPKKKKKGCALCMQPTEEKQQSSSLQLGWDSARERARQRDHGRRQRDINGGLEKPSVISDGLTCCGCSGRTSQKSAAARTTAAAGLAAWPS